MSDFLGSLPRVVSLGHFFPSRSAASIEPSSQFDYSTQGGAAIVYKEFSAEPDES
jgi:hypothetical protein